MNDYIMCDRNVKMYAKAFKQSKPLIVQKRKTTTHGIIKKTITKLSPRVPSGVAILSHPKKSARRSRAIFLFVLLIWFFGVAT